MLACVTYEHLPIASDVAAVYVIARRRLAMHTHPDIFGILTKWYRDTVVEYITFPFPETIVSKLLALFHNATFKMVYLLEPFMFHVG